MNALVRRWERWIVVVLVIGYFVLGLSASRYKSQTGDEGIHLTGGVSYWAFNDYRIQPENGNWPQRWCGLPVFLSGFRFPLLESPAWLNLQQWTTAREFFYDYGNDADAMLFRGRIMTGLLGVGLAILVYGWSKRLFGALGGIFSLIVFVFSPTMLTHGFLITSDMACGLFFLASVGALWRMLHRVSIATVVLCWISLSALFLSKFSAPIIIPIGLLLVAIRSWNTQPIQLCFRGTREVHGWLLRLAIVAGLIPVMILGVAIMIWASCGFRYSMLNPAQGRPSQSVPWSSVEGSSWAVNQGVAIARKYHLLPEAYLFGFSHALFHSESRSAFLNGEYRRYGWLSFFPYCLVLKTPMELFFLLLLAGVATWGYRYQRNERVRDESGELRLEADSRRIALLAENEKSEVSDTNFRLLYDVSPLIVLFVVYWCFSLASHLNIGHRHLLPTYPVMMILVGASAWWFRSSKDNETEPSRNDLARSENHRNVRVTIARYIVCIALGFYLAEAFWIWPHYLAYFNLLAGGPRYGYKHLVDSSLDWSQDMKAIRGWLDNRPDEVKDRGRTYLSLFCDPPPEYYGIHADPLPSFPFRWQPHCPEPLTGGTYLISATMLQRSMLDAPGRWNREYEDQYQALRTNIELYRNLSATDIGKTQLLSHATELTWQNMFMMFEILRFSRLASFLNKREPDEQIGYSIMIYNLTQKDIDLATDGPPVELLDMPEWKIEDLRRGRLTANGNP